MSPIKRPAAQGAIVSLSQSGHYWRKRAAEHTKRGQNRQAAALLRHAVSLHPLDDRLRLEYAQSLQAMGCYESSNREAFDALACNPRSLNAFALISRNMLALGRHQEAVDAYSNYASLLGCAPEDALVDDDLEAVEELFDDDSLRRMARYKTLIELAYGAMTRNDLRSARHHLQKAETLRYHDDRLFTFSSSLALEENDLPRALRDAKRAVKHAPYSMKGLCILARAYHAVGNKLRAKLALLSAAKNCACPPDLALICITAAMIDQENIALNILKSNIRKAPNSVYAPFDTAVMLIHAGRLEEAAGYIHRCRELDPRDVPTQCLFHLIEAWRQQPPDPVAAKAVPYYPMLPPQEWKRLLEKLFDVLKRDAQGFISSLCTSSEMCDMFLYGIAKFDSLAEPILTQCVEVLPKEQAEVILRRVLLFDKATLDAKFPASALLYQLGADPPFTMCSLGRIMHTGLTSEAELPKSLMLPLRRLLALVARQHASPALNTHTLSLLRRMTPKQQSLLFKYDVDVWIQAFALHYRLSAPAQRSAAKALSEMKTMPHMKHRVREAVLTLCDLTEGGFNRWRS